MEPEIWEDKDADQHNFDYVPSLGSPYDDPLVVTWFRVFIHHADTTAAEWIEVSLFCGRTCTAHPTELILAERTCHVIASFVFLDPGATHWAERYAA